MKVVERGKYVIIEMGNVAFRVKRESEFIIRNKRGEIIAFKNPATKMMIPLVYS